MVNMIDTRSVNLKNADTLVGEIRLPDFEKSCRDKRGRKK
jgi:hypothetical protein